MSEPTLVIPDVHENLEFIERIMNRYGHIRKKVLLGDWLDSFEYHANPLYHLKTLYEILDNPDNDIVAGNHDIQYLFPKVKALGSSGWRQKNLDVLQETLSEEHRIKWTKLHKWVRTKGKTWLLSHAGFHPTKIEHPVFGVTEQYIELLTSGAIEQLRLGQMSHLVAPGWRRGGHRDEIGGVTWLDWRDFKPVAGINQIVGHTHGNLVREFRTEDSENYCLDTGQRHVAIIEPDGKVTTESVYA